MTNLPVTGFFRVTCEYKRLNTDKLKWAAGYHTGIDIVSDNKKVYSTCNGNVFQAGYDNAYGNFIVIRDFETDNFHWFCHLNRIFVKQGIKVTKTTCIGMMGSTGNVTGLHLHFEIRKSCNCYGKVLNPAEYMGIPNKVGTYFSDNYKIDNFKKGDVIYTKCEFTGAERVQENSSLIEKHGKQFWIYNSSLNDAKNIMRVVICYIEGDSLMVECDSVTSENKQFWINKNEVVK